MKNSNTVRVKHERGSKSHSGWTPLLSDPDILHSSKEDRSVWPVGRAVPNGDAIQAKAQEKPAFLNALAHKSGDNVRSEYQLSPVAFSHWHFRFNSVSNSSYQVERSLPGCGAGEAIPCVACAL